MLWRCKIWIRIDMESVHWDAHLEMGLAEVDRQHHYLVDPINRFDGLLTQLAPVGGDSIAGALNELAAYLQYHFKEEEYLMRREGVDARHFEQQRQMHAGFMQEVTDRHLRRFIRAARGIPTPR